jgi:hypothetical protein
MNLGGWYIEDFSQLHMQHFLASQSCLHKLHRVERKLEEEREWSLRVFLEFLVS